ncbi:Serine/threonine-protein kinase pelle [Frankliniella fusca]|uniref:Serine/threonine-protein kinase pelle n=1 Tax=Frankliniella fusca TaxID=407009 RepID=A0AAE1LVT5_9NEOP|nr:Serine/threonine-protein kinase pelle [Frankliniella fusca]
MADHLQQARIKRNKITHIYELPEDIRMLLCYRLNSEQSWHWLLALIYDEEDEDKRYTMEQIKEVGGSSPSAELLKLLGDRNFTVEVLYLALASLNLKSAMRLLEEFVSDEFKNSAPFSAENEECPSVAFSRIVNVGSIENIDVNTFQSPPTQNESSLSTRSENITVTSQQAQESSQPAYFPRGESVVSYRQLIQATNDWSSENCLDSKRKVNFYHGLLNGKEVAIKKLDPQQEDQLLEEIRRLRSASSNCENILKMLMFVEGNGNPCMVYPFMRNGSLYDQINQTPTEGNEAFPNFTLEKQVDIAYGIANALYYLRSEVFNSAVVVKSSDILMGELMSPQLADVSLPSAVKRPAKPLSLYLPESGSNGGNEDKFCLGTIVIELAIGLTADKLLVHPETWFREHSSKITSDHTRALIHVCFGYYGCWDQDIHHIIKGWECFDGGAKN